MVKQALLLTGIGLRTPHYTAILEKKPKVAWLEVHSENYFAEGGRPLYVLEKVRRDYPISLHGVGLSIGSADELNWAHLKKLRDLVLKINPCLVSDHLCWSSIHGQHLHDLLPLPYTEEALLHVVDRIQQIQDYLQRQILIENISSYITHAQSTLKEEEFLSEIANRAGCGILLDVNNLYVNAYNLNFDPMSYIRHLPAHLVQEIHLAGFSQSTIKEKEVLIDTHDHPVSQAVWELFQTVIQHMGVKPTIIEWDQDLPSLETLCLQAEQAEALMRENYVTPKLTG